jgi:D-lactate dehydrogenase
MPAAPRIVFLETEEADRALVRESFPDAVFADAPPADAEIVSTFVATRFPRKVIESLPKLKLLCTRSVGYDHIDVDACRERGVTVCNVPDYGSHVIAEHVFALLLSALRHIREGEDRVDSGVFDYHGLRGMALKDKTIGILGTGKIGRAVARIAWGFGMRILATDQCRTLELETQLGVTYVPYEELLRQSDILTLHIPATPETEHLLNDGAFEKMKNGVVLVNTARGSLINSPSLLRALENGKVSHALLDVLEHEQNFQENKALIKHPRVVTTPHIAFYADDSLRNMYQDTLRSIEQWLRGEKPEHSVRPQNVICDLPALRS